MLSHRLLVFGLVGHYPTNYLISRKLLPKRPEPFFQSSLLERKVRGIRPDFSGLSPSSGQITYVLLSRPPLDMCSPKKAISFDLHALGAPPAFVLSQDQTLVFVIFPSTIQLLKYIKIRETIIIYFTALRVNKNCPNL